MDADVSHTEPTLTSLRGHYRSGQDDLERDFFRPCLKQCSSYERAVGYFRSSVLIAWTEILPRLARDEDVHIRLLASPELSAEDTQALEQAVDPDEKRCLLEEFCSNFILGILQSPQQLQDATLRLRLFAWLIAKGDLEIRFAMPDHVPDSGIYHEKMGIFTFPSGELVAFTGSANESRSGHHRNWESIDVFRSWITADLEELRPSSFSLLRHGKGERSACRCVPCPARPSIVSGPSPRQTSQPLPPGWSPNLDLAPVPIPG